MEQKNSITVAEFKEKLDKGEVQFLFDLRAEDEFKDWRIEGRTEVETLNIPQEDFVGEEEGQLHRFPRDKEIITVCAHGDSAVYSADLLRENGFNAIGIEGGMDAWSEFYETHKVMDSPAVYQVYRVAKNCISHVIISDGEAIVIDAVRHTQHITKIIDENNAKLVGVVDTHLQADHISGGVEIAKQYSAPYYISLYDAKGAGFEFINLKNHNTIKVGSSTLEVYHTPGHTPGSTSLLLDGKVLFTGDTIMETSIGRPDLGGMGSQWAGFLYYTLFERLKGLPDDTKILPTHAASVKEQNEDGVVVFTLGFARENRSPYQIVEFEAFKKHIMNSLLTNPDRYAEIRQVNLGTIDPDEKKRKELEIGKNLCGMAGKGGA